MTPAPLLPFDNAYARPPAHFFTRLPPTPVSKPSLIEINDTTFH